MSSRLDADEPEMVVVWNGTLEVADAKADRRPATPFIKHHGVSDLVLAYLHGVIDATAPKLVAATGHDLGVINGALYNLQKKRLVTHGRRTERSKAGRPSHSYRAVRPR